MQASPHNAAPAVRILFVDDDANVLSGLRRSLHGMRQLWMMSFAASGAEALGLLSRTPIDVLVTDMRMPGMTGHELLIKVKQLYPNIIRFVLSGYAESSSIMKIAGTAHQYLSKPCDGAVLKTAIDRTYALRDLLCDEALMRQVGDVDSLPVLPGAYQRIAECLNEPEPEIGRIAKIVGADVAMTTMTLKLANSAFFGAKKSFRTVDRAVAFLGLDTIGGLLMAGTLFNELTPSAVGKLNLDQLWNHSLSTGMGARTIARLEKQSEAFAEEAFLAGMMHDLGKLVLASRTAPLEVDAAGGEHAAYDGMHGETGAYLLGLWGFSDTIVEAIAVHETPSKAPGPGLDLVCVLHVADRLASHFACGDPCSKPRFEPGFLESRGCVDRVDEWKSAWSRTAA